MLNKYLFLTSKPVIYLVNLSEKDFIRKKNKWLIKIKEWVDKNDPGATIIPFSGAYEHTLGELKTPEARKEHEVANKCPSALDKIVITGYKNLNLEYFFTSGADEVRAWSVMVSVFNISNAMAVIKCFLVCLFRKVQRPHRLPAEFIQISRKDLLWLK